MSGGRVSLSGRRLRLAVLLPVAVALPALLWTAPADNKPKALYGSDVQLRAMVDEMTRSKTLQLNNLEKPYFIQYTSDDSDQLLIVGSLGGITHSNEVRLRRPGGIVRVGSYGFDNANSIYSSPLHFSLFPLDDDYQAMRNTLWRTTDILYKTALEQIARKRNALREMAEPDKTADLAPAKPLQEIEPVPEVELERSAWEQSVRRSSERFTSFSKVLTSSVRVQEIASTYRLVNSEGAVVRFGENLNEVQIRASGRTANGVRIWNHLFRAAIHPQQLPRGEQLDSLVDAVAKETEALSQAPASEDYSGPVLFEGEAAAEMMAQSITDAAVLNRRPVAPPNANSAALQVIDSPWSSRVGMKVSPDWLTIYDDPLTENYRGQPLAGHYTIDDEGVPAERVSLVEKGTFKGFLLSRMPVRTFNASNGHGRLPGPFGSEQAVIGNLFVEAAQPLSESQLKARLIERAKAAGLNYGLVLRRLDFPSSARLGDLQSFARQLQKNGISRTLNQPILAYRVYLDGHEELIRGLRFREFSAKDLRDVDAASDRPYVFNYVNNGSSLNIDDLRSEATTSSVICPSLLFDSVELAKAEDEAEAPPVVAPPALVAKQ